MKFILLILLYLTQSFAIDIHNTKSQGTGFYNARRNGILKPIKTKKPYTGNYTAFPPLLLQNRPHSPVFSFETNDLKKDSQNALLRYKRDDGTPKRDRIRGRLPGGKLKSNPKPQSKLTKKRRLRKLEKPKKTRTEWPSRRLISGRDARIEDYPYVVSIQKERQHWCSGALLNPRLVITTANCIWKADTESHLRVRAGSRYTDRGGQMASIKEVAKHPLWSIRKNPNYDLGLLLLDRNLKFSDKIHAVDLPNVRMTPPFDDAWVTSWGADRRDGVYAYKSMNLQVVHMRLMDRSQCNNITMRFGVAVTKQFICLAQTGKTGPCTRDTGAPAVSDGVVWGLASWGLRKLCGTERFPAMFSYTASDENMDFIKNATRFLMSDKRYDPFPDKFVMKSRPVPLINMDDKSE